MSTHKESTQAQHTPGPWVSDLWGSGWSVSAPDSHYTVCRPCDCNRAEANARLIAAAPELLTALKDVMSEADFGDSALAEKCRAAIAKAEGRTA